MKKGVIYLIFIILLSFNVLAISVTLYSPSGNIDSGNVEFKCKVNTIGDLANLSLYHNKTIFDFIKANDSNVVADTIYTFTDTFSEGSYEWNCLATLQDNTQTFANSNYTFKYSSSSNAPTLISDIPNIIWNEDTSNNSLNLNDYFTDPNGDSLTYSVKTMPSHVNVEILGSNVNMTPSENWFGSENVIFIANDGSLTAESNEVTLNVIAVDDSPILIKNITNKTWAENTNKKLDLDDYFSDPDGDSLNYSYTFISSSPYNINVSFSGDEVTFKPEVDWTGEEKIKLVASDSNYSVTSNEFILIVTSSGNNPPEINSFTPSSTLVSISPGETQTFDIVKTDSDNDDITIGWYVDNVLQTGEITDSFSFTPTNEGIYSIKVSVTDGQNVVHQTWSLTVGSSGVTDQIGSRCGDGIAQMGEGCQSCPEDIKCKKDEECVNNKCVVEKKRSFTLIIIIVGGILLITAGVAFYFYRKEKKEVKDIEKQGKEKEVKNEGKEFYQAAPKKEMAKVKKVVKKEPIKKEFIKDKLYYYIERQYRRGIDKEHIKNTLIDKGWDENTVKEKIDYIYDTEKRIRGNKR